MRMKENRMRITKNPFGVFTDDQSVFPIQNELRLMEIFNERGQLRSRCDVPVSQPEFVSGEAHWINT